MANRKVILLGGIIAAVSAVIWLLYNLMIFVLPPMASSIVSWSPNDSLLLLFIIGMIIAAVGAFLPG